MVQTESLILPLCKWTQCVANCASGHNRRVLVQEARQQCMDQGDLVEDLEEPDLAQPNPPVPLPDPVPVPVPAPPAAMTNLTDAQFAALVTQCSSTSRSSGTTILPHTRTTSSARICQLQLSSKNQSVTGRTWGVQNQRKKVHH